MFHRLLILVSLCFSISACAKRNYVDNISTSLLSFEALDSKCPYYFKKEKLCLSIKWDNEPSDADFSSLTMTFYKKNNPKIAVDPVLSPFVFLWMPDMGHGSAPVTMEKTSTGTYKASRIYFSMPGEWAVRYQIRDGKKVIEEYAQTVHIH